MITSAREWYQAISDGSLEQGDFFSDCQIVLPRMDSSTSDAAPQLKADIQLYDIVVLSQSCDLVQNKLSHVLVCRTHPLSALPALANQPQLAGKALAKLQEQVRRGNQPPLHMLAASTLENLEREVQLADFREVFSVPMDYVCHLAGTRSPRLRLNSPYREHLSQAFARYFMRVGLPSDIPSFV